MRINKAELPFRVFLEQLFHSFFVLIFLSDGFLLLRYIIYVRKKKTSLQSMFNMIVTTAKKKVKIKIKDLKQL